MSVALKSPGERHEPKEFVVTTFSSKPKRREASRDILWSEVWDAESPLPVGHPFRWVLQKLDDKVRIRDLGTETERLISRPVEDIPFEELDKHGAIALGGEDKARCWLLIQPVRELRVIERDAAEGGWSPEVIRPAAVSDAVATRVFKRSALGVLGAMTAAWLLLYFLPKPKPTEELIPEQFAKVLLSPAFKSSGSPGRAASGKSGGTINIVQAFQSATVQKTTKTLLSAGAAKALLSGSTLLNTAAASAQARKVFDSKSVLSTAGVPGSKNLEAKSTSVGLLGGRGGGTGHGAGTAGYGQGAGANVDGQGSGAVSVGGEGAGISEGLTRDEVGKVIRDHMAEVRYCYEAALLRSPGLEGKLVASFTVRANGVATGVKVKESSGDAGLDQCIILRIAKWKFPKPRGGVNVAISYPFIFKSLGN